MGSIFFLGDSNFWNFPSGRGVLANERNTPFLSFQSCFADGGGFRPLSDDQSHGGCESSGQKAPPQQGFSFFPPVLSVSAGMNPSIPFSRFFGVNPSIRIRRNSEKNRPLSAHAARRLQIPEAAAQWNNGSHRCGCVLDTAQLLNSEEVGELPVEFLSQATERNSALK